MLSEKIRQDQRSNFFKKKIFKSRNSHHHKSVLLMRNMLFELAKVLSLTRIFFTFPIYWNLTLRGWNAKQSFCFEHLNIHQKVQNSQKQYVLVRLQKYSLPYSENITLETFPVLRWPVVCSCHNLQWPV